MKHSLERVAHELRARLGHILTQQVADPRLTYVSISEVKPSKDLGVAKVYYRTLGDHDEAAEAIGKAKAFIRNCLAKESRMRRVPELIFILDETLENAERLESILREVRPEEEPS